MTHKRVASFLWLTLRKNAFVTFQKIDLNEMVRDGLHCRLTSSVTSAPEKAGARSSDSFFVFGVFVMTAILRRKMARRHRVAEPRLRGVAEVPLASHARPSDK